MKRLNPGILISAVWVAIVFISSLTAAWLPIEDPSRQSLLRMLAQPSLENWFGTDSLGRDVFARTLYGFRVTFTVSVGSVTLAILVGGTLGVVAGYFRGWIEATILALTNIVLAFPPLVLIIAMVAHPGSPIAKVIVALSIVFTPAVIRIARANTLLFAEREFVTAARAVGMSDLRLIVREILPNLLPAFFAYGLLLVAIGAMAEAGLSYLGLSVPPPASTLGVMMASEQANVMEAPHAVFFPAATLFATIFALNFIGEFVQRQFAGGGKSR